MDKGTQLKISQLVAEYKRVFPDEYEDFLKYAQYVRDTQATKYAELNMPESLVQRKLGEVPETLFTALQMKLYPNEMEYFKSKEGSRWFYKKHKEFRISKEV